MANHQQVHPENTTLSQWNGIVYFISVECHGEQTYSQQQLNHTWRNVLVRHLLCRFLPVYSGKPLVYTVFIPVENFDRL